TYRRPLLDRLLRTVVATVLPNPWLFRTSLRLSRLAKPLVPLLKTIGFDRLAAMLDLAPTTLPPSPDQRGQGFPSQGRRQGRVALLDGCANPVLAPSINASAIRLLNRHGIEVVIAPGEGCCGALVHHMGRDRTALRQARNNIDAWTREIERDGLDAILITT